MIRFLFVLVLGSLLLSSPIVQATNTMSITTSRETTKLEAGLASLPKSPANLSGLTDKLLSTYLTGTGKLDLTTEQLNANDLVVLRTSSGTVSFATSPGSHPAVFVMKDLNAQFTLSIPSSLTKVTVTIFSPAIIAGQKPHVLFKASDPADITSVGGIISLSVPRHGLLFFKVTDPLSKQTTWWRGQCEPTPAATQVEADNLLSINQPGSFGDLNGDGKLTVADATLALRLAIGLATATAPQLANGDMNHNGQIDIADAIIILKAAVGKA